MLSILEERFPHVVEGLLRTWGRPDEFDAFFNGLVFDTRTNRTGWPADAWDELSFLSKLHKLVHTSETDEPEPVHDDIKWV